MLDDSRGRQPDKSEGCSGKAFAISAAPKKKKNTAALALIRDLRQNHAVVDGGATIHGTPLFELVSDIERCAMKVMGVSGNSFTCTLKGKLRFIPTGNGRPIVFRNVHISKEFPATFISESALTTLDCCIVKKGGGGTVFAETGEVLFKLILRNGLYFADVDFVKEPTPLQTAAVPAAEESCSAPSALEEAASACLVAEEGALKGLISGLVLLAKSYSAREVVDQISRLHKRLSHMEFRKVADTFAINLPADYVFPLCGACVVGKTTA